MMAYIPVYDMCCHCEGVYLTKEGQYGTEGEFYCGGCISALFAEAPPRKKTIPMADMDPHAPDYSSVVEFTSLPGIGR